MDVCFKTSRGVEKVAGSNLVSGRKKKLLPLSPVLQKLLFWDEAMTPDGMCQGFVRDNNFHHSL